MIVLNYISKGSLFPKEDYEMIDTILAAATVKSIEEIMTEAGVPYEVRDDEEKAYFYGAWDDATDSERDLALSQAAPAIRRILSKEAYAYRAKEGPLIIRFNYQKRKIEKDSFGEILLERPEFDWHISISVKNDPKVLASLTLADRAGYINHGEIVNFFNEIDDFGERIFQVPCSNDYFKDMNEVLLAFEPYKKDDWMNLLKEDDFLYGKLITPMLRAIGAEMKRLCNRHPEAPQKLIDYFYGTYDYYFIKPIEASKVTRIGCVNSHGNLGRIPHSYNHDTPKIDFPTELLEVRFATGDHGELSHDTIQFNFDKGWALCLRIYIDENHLEERSFRTSVYLPVTPFGSYRDQVPWD